MAQLKEDIYGGGPSHNILRYWLSIPITRQAAEQSLAGAPIGSFILRRSESAPGNYAVTVMQDNGLRSYQVFDLGLGQVGLKSGQAFETLEHLIDFFYARPFPEPGNGHTTLSTMHDKIAGFPPPTFAPPPQLFAQASYESIGTPSSGPEYGQIDDGEATYGEISEVGGQGYEPATYGDAYGAGTYGEETYGETTYGEATYGDAYGYGQ
eukprot:m.352562 g.352562  ORF g.352562 m.352562 type:complete len:209 (-) comp16553_c0_seq1:1212-1838(-)